MSYTIIYINTIIAEKILLFAKSSLLNIDIKNKILYIRTKFNNKNI